MNWKTTAVLGVIAAGVLVALLVLQPQRTDPDQIRVDLLAGWTVASVERVVIERPGDVEIVVQRSSRPGGVVWTVEKPRSFPANPSMIDEMIGAVFGHGKSAFVKPDHPEYNLEQYGLRQPQLRVTLEGGGGKRVTFRYGRESKLNPGVLWIQRDGDPNVYFSTIEVVKVFSKDIYQLRNKRIAWYEPHRATKVTLTKQYLGRRGEFKYETTVAVHRQKDPKGWFFENPEERLDDAQVGALVSGVPNIIAEDFEPLGDKKSRGLVDPELKIQVETADGTFTYLVGANVPGRERRKYVWAEGSDEVALVDVERYLQPLPSSRNALRSRQIVYWGEDQTKRIEVESKELGRIVLEPHKRRITSENVTMEEIQWRVVEPAIEFDEPRCTNYARYLYTLALKDENSWVAAADGQDLKAYKLDPPDFSIKFVLEKEERTLHFGSQAGQDVIMKKGWHDELYWVPEEYVRNAKLMDLAFRKMKVWDVNPDLILGFWFEDPDNREGHRRLWQVMREGKGKEWKFIDQRNVERKTELDPGRVAKLLTLANYVEAKAFVGRDKASQQYYKLAENPLRKLHIIIGRAESDRKVLWISGNVGRGAQVYYGRFEDDPTVFRLDSELVELLIDGVDKAPREDSHDHH